MQDWLPRHPEVLGRGPGRIPLSADTQSQAASRRWVDPWHLTATRLGSQYMGEAQGDGPVLIASNRGPVSFTRGDDGRLSAKRGGGGMVSGLSAVADEGDMLWVCAALSDDDRAAARLAPDGLLDPADAGAGAAVRMLDIPEPIFYRAYNAVANSTLWFVHHMLYDTPNRPSFGPSFARDWEAFRTYNEMFAAALASAAANGDRTDRAPVRAVIQDYHLCLAPGLLAERAPGVRIAHFSHTPWAPPPIPPDTNPLTRYSKTSLHGRAGRAQKPARFLVVPPIP